MNSSYLSTLFKAEMGRSVSEYITSKKIEAARNMLRYSDYSYADISSILAFSSKSHFIRVFKKREGCTPKQYREAGEVDAEAHYRVCNHFRIGSTGGETNQPTAEDIDDCAGGQPIQNLQTDHLVTRDPANGIAYPLDESYNHLLKLPGK